MDWDVVNVQVIGAHTLFVRFRDGVQGEMQFKPSFFQGVFSRLADQKAFEDVRLVDGVVTWPDELDLAPDAMHDEIGRHGRWTVE
ncbi:MAG: DUF2442 domain-containing protein [Pseudomonadota bacterium]|nr:DUF2442 domain-containing protein [Pseudomonadota bacterium]